MSLSIRWTGGGVERPLSAQPATTTMLNKQTVPTIKKRSTNRPNAVWILSSNWFISDSYDLGDAYVCALSGADLLDECLKAGG